LVARRGRKEIFSMRCFWACDRAKTADLTVLIQQLRGCV
jgi:hypothetical protein